MNDVCFIVRDKNGQGLGYFYYEVGARPAHGRQHAHQGRSAAAGGEFCQAAGAVAAALVRHAQRFSDLS